MKTGGKTKIKYFTRNVQKQKQKQKKATKQATTRTPKK